MWRVYDRIKVVDAEHAEVGHRESSALVFMRRKFAVAGAWARVFHLGDSADSDFISASRKHWRKQAALNRHGHSHIGFGELQHPVACPNGIGLGDLLQRKSPGLDDEIVDRQLHATAGRAACSTRLGTSTARQG